jgi:hypothetical protein
MSCKSVTQVFFTEVSHDGFIVTSAVSNALYD